MMNMKHRIFPPLLRDVITNMRLATMFQRLGMRKNYLMLVLMAVGLIFLSYQFTGIRPTGPPSGYVLEEPCTPKKNVVFLKIHKTAGSTIQNIFMRHARKYQLLLVLPYNGNYLGHPLHFQTQLAPRLKKGYRYNILTHHARFNYEPMRALMPDDTVFVTILRDPVALFESLYSYYGLNATFNMDIVEYAMANESMTRHHNQRFFKKIGRNQMAFDLGVTKPEFDDDVAVARAIRRLDRQFHLVMISEMMDQSLVLLKNLLCWDVDDVVAFKHNVRLQSSKVRLSADVTDRLRDWNQADQQLYDHFYRRFAERIDAFGTDRMDREVNELRQRTKDWYDYCVEDEATGAELKGKYRVYSQQVYGFRIRETVHNDTCEDMAKAELPFTKEMQERQRKFLAISANLPMQFFYRNKSFYHTHYHP